MNDEWQYLLDAMQWKFGWLIGITAWQSAIRIVLVFFNSKLKELMEQSLPEDSAWIASMLNSRWYRLTTFILNAVLSVKLPAKAAKVAPL
jgi:hypothetical protein